MQKTTTELTQEYIKEHFDVKSCLKKGIINYSALARLIGKELRIEKQSSKEAILVAAVRMQKTLEKEASIEKKVKELLSKSETEIKNKIVALTLEKDADFEKIQGLQKQILQDSGCFYLIQGSNSNTVITQQNYLESISAKLKHDIIKERQNLVLINFKTPKEIEQTTGAIYYITSMFSENNVNIVEFISCWTDTILVIDSKDLSKAINFIKF
ncbi:MAG: hypothetical protein Q7R70_02735 [Candidatus Diapherotrites archaeon]|nr:hypothetical protein [Candidatus Diapherotrites archaeon]